MKLVIPEVDSQTYSVIPAPYLAPEPGDEAAMEKVIRAALRLASLREGRGSPDEFLDALDAYVEAEAEAPFIEVFNKTFGGREIQLDLTRRIYYAR